MGVLANTSLIRVACGKWFAWSAGSTARDASVRATTMTAGNNCVSRTTWHQGLHIIVHLRTCRAGVGGWVGGEIAATSFG